METKNVVNYLHEINFSFEFLFGQFLFLILLFREKVRRRKSKATQRIGMHSYVKASNFKYPITVILVRKNFVMEVESDQILGGRGSDS